MLIAEHPGHWLNFVNRADNRGLTTEQQRVKYLQEQLLFENFMSFQIQQRLIQQNQSAGGTPSVPVIPAIPSNCIEFVVNTYYGFTYYFDMVSSGSTDYTINWGDGNTETGNVDGTTSLNHNYADEGSYTARLCFSDVSLITELDFIGDD